MALQEVMEKVEAKMGDVDRKLIYAHQKFVELVLDYIISDFGKSRGSLNDSGIGGMVICYSSEQTKHMFELFNRKNSDKMVSLNS